MSVTRPVIIGHRGAPRLAPENTLASFAAARRLGADGIELDVQLSSDGVPVVIHDLTLERTTNGRGSVSAYTLAALQALDAGSFFAANFERERIPTLRDVASLVRGAIELHVEIKGTTPGIVAATLMVLQECRVIEQSLVTSFHHSLVLEAKELLPGLRTGILLDEGWLSDRPLERANQAVSLAQAVHADFVDLHVSLITPELVRGIGANGLGISAWTVDDPDQARQLAAIGIDRIISNAPYLILPGLTTQGRDQRPSF